MLQENSVNQKPLRKQTKKNTETKHQFHVYHQQALEAASRYKKTEVELIDVLQKIDHHKLYIQNGNSSLFEYITGALKLSENVAYSFMGICRKAVAKTFDVPQLKLELEKGTITLSNARSIVPVLNSSNQAEWLKKASELSNRNLQKAIASKHPALSTPERVMYVAESRVKMELGLPNLVSQARQKSVSLEEVIIVLVNEYLTRNDPVEKAKRMIVKKGVQAHDKKDVTRDGSSDSVGLVTLPVNITDSKNCKTFTEPVLSTNPAPESAPESAAESAAAPILVPASAPVSAPAHAARKFIREPIPASLIHQVRFRDQGQCTHINADGKRCTCRRFLEIHHIKAIFEGGKNTLENLITLCDAHHDWIHSIK
jgi:hypothetical protein